MTVIALIVGWWLFLVVFAIALSRARDRKPLGWRNEQMHPSDWQWPS